LRAASASDTAPNVSLQMANFIGVKLAAFFTMARETNDMTKIKISVLPYQLGQLLGSLQVRIEFYLNFQ
jgi:hypothetical protein